jgi:hypothetical protein
VAFFLYSANDITVKLFEGYLMPKFLRELLTNIPRLLWFDQATSKYKEYLEMAEKLDAMKEDDLTPEFQEKFFNQWREARKEIHEHELRGPFEEDNLLPTRLGNVLRASEVYANDRYFIEELTIWPRLIPVMPPEFTKVLEEKNNHLMFLLNSTLLALAIGVSSLFFAILGVPCGMFPGSGLCGFFRSQAGFFSIGYDNLSPIGLMGIGISLVGFGYLLYSIGVNVAGSMGVYIRTGFDLYRENLLRQLNWRLPLTLSEERTVWEEICQFYSTGEKIKKADFPPYCYYDNPAFEGNLPAAEPGNKP